MPHEEYKNTPFEKKTKTNKQIQCSNGPSVLSSTIKPAKSKKSCKIIGQEYFRFIIQNNMIFLLASMEAKNQLDTSYRF